MFVQGIYCSLAVVGVYMYGKGLNTSILQNIGDKYADNKVYAEAYAM